MYWSSCWCRCAHKAFNNYTTEFVHNTFFCSFDTWKWLILDHKLQEWNMDDNWYAWLILSVKLSLYQGNLFHLIDFIRQAVYTWGDNCSTWVIFSDKLTPHGEIKDNFIWFLVFISCRFERLKKGLSAPFMVFPYIVQVNNQLFVTM